MANTLRPYMNGTTRIFCACGTELKVTKSEFGYNHLLGGPTLTAKAEPCSKCIREAATHPMTDWLPGV